jgi:hypothetical protein
VGTWSIDGDRIARIFPARTKPVREQCFNPGISLNKELIFRCKEW